MVNIWIINHHASYYNGRHFYMGGYLAEQGFNVRIIRASTKHTTGKQIRDFEGLYDEEVINNCTYTFIKAREYGKSSVKRLQNILDFTKNAKKTLRKENFEKPDIIIASSVHPLAWYVGRNMSRKYKVPLILETRDLWPETFVSMGMMKRKSLPSSMMYAFEKHYYTIADALIFTLEGRDKYLESIGINRTAYYVNNGVDIDTYEMNRENHRYLDSGYLEDQRFKVVYTGSMGKANRVDLLMKCAEILKTREIDDICFYLFGSGKEEESLKKYAEEQELSNVHFMGRVEANMIPSILSRSQLNIISGNNISLYDYGLSLNKLFDYCASGKPILSTLVNGYDILEKYGAGVTIKDASPESVADNILYFKNLDQESYGKYCRGAVTAASSYDYKILAEQYRNIIKSTLDSYER